MGWITAGKVSHNGYARRVAFNSDTGEVERSFGTDKNMSKETTSRRVGHASSAAEACKIAHEDLKDSFRKK